MSCPDCNGEGFSSGFACPECANEVPCVYCGHTETPGTVMRWNATGTDWECEGPEPCDMCDGTAKMTKAEANMLLAEHAKDNREPFATGEDDVAF
jgi:hypothetical protein